MVQYMFCSENWRKFVEDEAAMGEREIQGGDDDERNDWDNGLATSRRGWRKLRQQGHIEDHIIHMGEELQEFQDGSFSSSSLASC